MRRTPIISKAPGNRQKSTPLGGYGGGPLEALPAGYPEALESILQAAVRALPRSDGGFTIEVRPLAAARAGSGGLQHRNTERQARGTGGSGDKLEIHDKVGLGDGHAPADNWRPKGRAVLTLAEVAQALSLSRTTVHRLVQDGKLEVIHVGRRVLVLIEVVEAFLAAGAGIQRCA